MHLKILLPLVGLALSPLVATAEDILARVNDVPVTAEMLQREIQANPELTQQPDGRQKLLDKLINGELLVQEAKKLGLEDSPEVKREMAGLLRQVLANAAANRYLADKPISDAEIRARYDKLSAEADKTEYHARHVLTPSREVAEKVLARIRKGEPFAKVAQQSSLDTATAEQGGDLGWFIPSAMVREFSAAVEKLKPGELSAPVQTGFGWHVVELVATRPTSVAPLEKVKDKIRSILASERIDEHIAALKAKADIRMLP